MLDNQLLRQDINAVAAHLARRGYTLDVAAFSALEEQRKELQTKTQQLQNERNTRSKSIGQAKARGEDIEPLMAEVSQLGDELDVCKTALETVQASLDDILLR